MSDIYCRDEFYLDSNVTFLNNGSYGVTPKIVLEKQFSFMRERELNPDYQNRVVSFQEHRDSLLPLAEFVGANVQDMVFVVNATTAINSVVNSWILEKDDCILITNHIYYSVREILIDKCKKTGSKLIEIKIPLPLSDHQIIVDCAQKILQENQQIKFAVFDHITSPSALLLPIEKLINLCHEKKIKVMIDGAHAIGQIPLNLNILQADYYVTNCHKWLFSSKGCAILWAKSQHQNSLFPPVISLQHNDVDWTKRFWMQATRDETAFLSAPFGLLFLKEKGVENVRSYNNNLILQSTELFCTTFGNAPCVPFENNLHMGLITMPEKFVDTEDMSYPCVTKKAFDLMLFFTKKHKINAAFFSYNRKLYCRLSAQIYNKFSDYILLLEKLK